MEENTEILTASHEYTVNLNQICRFCADIDSKLYPIFENKFDEKVQSFVSIKVLKDDGLPYMICALCKYKVNTAYEFRLLAISVDRKLRELLTNDDSFSTENEEKLIENIQKLETSDQVPTTIDEIKNDNLEIPKNNDVELNITDIQNIIEERVKVETINLKNDLRVKRRQEKLINKVDVVCPECGRTVKKHCLKDHIKTHTRIADCKCEICGQMLLTRCRLWMHKRDVHGKKELINCDQCGKTFSTNSVFRIHYRTVHLKIKKYKCEVCNRTFGCPKTLKMHIQTHTGARPYICHHCGRGMSTPYALRQHIRLHTNEAPYKCEECGESFKQRVTMKLHYRRQHLGITPEQERFAKMDDST